MYTITKALCVDFPHLLPGDAVDCLGRWRKLCESHLIGSDRGVAWDARLRHVHAYASRIVASMIESEREKERDVKRKREAFIVLLIF